MGEAQNKPVLNQVFFPSSFQELFSAWSRFPEAVPFAGGAELIRGQGKRVPLLPGNILSLEKLEDLRRITRTERYLEIGAMVRLNEIIRLGKIVPEVLTKCLAGIAGPQLRNIATIGGNICNPSRRFDTTAPMIALDAHYELRSAQSARWISAARFSSFPGPTALAAQELLTRIRIPLEQWNYSLYRKFNTQGSGEPGGVMIFILRNQKNILEDIRVVFSDNSVFREKNSESMLIGKKLPLDRKDALSFIERWKSYLNVVKAPEERGGKERDSFDFIRAQILSFIKTSIIVLV
ncbi:MAG: FAD binding domain-containing protein [Treponema sp.]|jgi:CO/xanthine dehydrogenase FAD-binding subunit|nr:FAD binding domain-containing protein [Treponema sp.]